MDKHVRSMGFVPELRPCGDKEGSEKVRRRPLVNIDESDGKESHREHVNHDLVREEIQFLHVIAAGVLGVGEAVEVRDACASE